MQPTFEVTSHRIERVERSSKSNTTRALPRVTKEKPEIACQPGTPTAIQTKSDLQLALQVLVLVEPGLDVGAVALNPDNLGADGVEALLHGTVVTL